MVSVHLIIYENLSNSSKESIPIMNTFLNGFKEKPMSQISQKDPKYIQIFIRGNYFPVSYLKKVEVNKGS
jgi:hypothetical protein